MTPTPVENRMRHPWHPIFVHFPIACWIMGFAVEVVYHVLPELWLPAGIEPGALALLLLWAGNVTALAAVVAGLIDLAQLPDTEAVMSTVYKHMGWMISAWLLMLGAGVLHIIDSDSRQLIVWTRLAVEMAGIICLVLGGLQASRLVYHLNLGEDRAC